MMEPQINEGDLITVTQLVKLLKLAPGTIYNIVGQLGPDDGVVCLGARCTRILKPKFFERLLAGKIRLGPRHEQRSRR
jgi:hypothetical protein